MENSLNYIIIITAALSDTIFIEHELLFVVRHCMSEKLKIEARKLCSHYIFICFIKNNSSNEIY
jgi:hypothetical protein